MTPHIALLAFLLAGLVAALVLWPGRGLLARLVRRLRRTVPILADDALKLLYHRGTRSADEIGRELKLPGEQTDAVIGRLMREGRISGESGAIGLTESGRARALQVIRTHRLWERYLADRTGLGARDWHEEAERVEHVLSPAEADRLSARMGRPRFDPHGDPIPAADGALAMPEGLPLSELDTGDAAEVVHVEDEPDEPYARLVAAGIAAGQLLRVTARDAAGLALSIEGREVRVSGADSAQVTVHPLAEVSDHPVRSLATLRQGETAVVAGLAAACRGAQRRRLLDLGAVPGTPVSAEFSSPLGDPMVYRLRGAAIALRREQAEWVLVEAGDRRPATGDRETGA